MSASKVSSRDAAAEECTWVCSRLGVGMGVRRGLEAVGRKDLPHAGPPGRTAEAGSGRPSAASNCDPTAARTHAPRQPRDAHRPLGPQQVLEQILSARVTRIPQPPARLPLPQMFLLQLGQYPQPIPLTQLDPFLHGPCGPLENRTFSHCVGKFQWAIDRMQKPD
jgi:hypothetical protein